MCFSKFSSLPTVTILALTILVAGCAGPARLDQTPQNWQQQSSALSTLEHWKMQGKMAFRSLDRAESTSISWLQDKQHTLVRLSGPLGFSATTISSDGEVIEVIQAEETRHYNVSDTTSMYTDTGIELPLQALPYWLKGLPHPDAAIDKQEFLQGKLKQLVQLGWTISYEQYKPFSRFLLPTKINMAHADTQVRLIK
jgi:outer membrane lipoprotein LolB